MNSMNGTIRLTKRPKAPMRDPAWNAVRLTSEAYAAAVRITGRTGRTLKESISELILLAEPMIQVDHEDRCEDCPYKGE